MTPCREAVGPRNKHGYVRVAFGEWVTDGTGRRHRRVVMLHRWVVEQIEGPLEPHERVLHLCDNPPCFLYEHLQRGTQADNVHDMISKGRARYVSGPDHPAYKLTDAQVAEIRSLFGSMPQRALARRFGVSRQLVRGIGSGEHRPAASCPQAGEWRKET